MLPPTLEEFQAAHAIIKSQVRPTILCQSEWLSKELDAEVHLKFEFLQPGRSFKIRGALNTLLSQDDKPSQVFASSGGNHGIAVTVACNEIEVPCCIILPKSTSPHKISVLQRLGAEVVVHGTDWDDAHSFGTSLAKEKNGLYIHPFADRSVIVGQGTIAIELVEELSSFDVVIASAGGGGLLTGIALALEAIGSKEQVEIISAETFGADCVAQSVRADKIVELPTITSIARSLGAKKTSPFIFETISRRVNKCVVISDEQAVSTLFQFLDEEKILIEPAASCSIAAALENRDYLIGKKIVIIVCGANIHLSEVLEWKSMMNLT